MKKNKEPRILIHDIESLPNVGTFWRPGTKVNIGYENILEERRICVIGWKWLGDNKVHVGAAKSPAAERRLLVRFAKQMAKADAVVAHNGDKFDIPYIRTRATFHKVPTLAPVKQIDTLKIARSKFMFNSNRLDYLGQFLKCGNKIKTEYSLWKRCLAKEKKAYDEMVKYNVQDVLLLEKVYKKLAPYFPAHLTRALYGAADTCSNLSCESTKTQRRGWSYTKTAKYARFQCTECGTWSRSRTAEKVKPDRIGL